MPPPGVKTTPKKVGKFTVGTFDTHTFGERIIIYGDGGIGKSTLASLAPDPIFVPLSNGAKEIRTPNGKKVPCIFGIESFGDLREALTDSTLWSEYKTVIVDDLTELSAFAERRVIENYPPPKNRSKITSLQQFGFDGAAYLVETMRLFLNDIDFLVQQDKHFVGLAHGKLAKIASAEGADYVEAGPQLQHNNQYSVRNTFFNWSDHLVRIDFADKFIIKDKDETRGKIEAGDDRIIYTQKKAQYLAKSRQLRSSGKALPSEIAFTSPADDSFWKFVGGAEVG